MQGLNKRKRDGWIDGGIARKRIALCTCTNSDAAMLHDRRTVGHKHYRHSIPNIIQGCLTRSGTFSSTASRVPSTSLWR